MPELQNLSFKHRCAVRLIHCIAMLPLSVLQVVGSLLGYVTYAFSKSYRDHLDANLIQAVGANAAKTISLRAIAEAGKTIFELPWLWLRPSKLSLSFIRKVEGWQCVVDARNAGKGTLFLTPHLGCFEITAQYAASKSMIAPITVLFRQPRQQWVESILLEGRNRVGMQIAPANLNGVRRLIRALKAGESVGLLPDQVPSSGQGMWLPWFGKPAYTMTLAARLAQTGASVIFAYAERLPNGGGFVLRCSPPEMPLPLEDLKATAVAINLELMKLISSCPAQYIWGYNRYKTPRGGRMSPPENRNE